VTPPPRRDTAATGTATGTASGTSGGSAAPAALVAPGVHRLGDSVVNFYLVEDPAGLLLVDAGLPGHRAALTAELAALGASPADVRAVLLTHAHPDHTGLAGRLNTEAGTEVWVHAADAQTVRDGPRSALRHAKPERSFLPYLLRRPGAVRTPLHLARAGAFGAPPVERPRTFGGEAGTPDLSTLPGRPQVVPVPGHTPGSVAFHFPDRGLLFTGDALVTYDGLTGATGPTLVCAGFTHDTATALGSLDRLAELPPALVLPGHGEPYPDGPRTAAEAARSTAGA
jgi:glyoxylase-like metal-dependent hydrolase (beta-lactamase superfamily II)